MNILKSYLPVIYANKYLYMRKNTPVYCRLNLYENLRELMRIKSNTFCLYERKEKNPSKYSTIITLTKSVWSRVVCSQTAVYTAVSNPRVHFVHRASGVRLNSNANLASIANIRGNIGSRHKTMNFTFLSTKSHSKLLGVLCAITESKPADLSWCSDHVT